MTDENATAKNNATKDDTAKNIHITAKLDVVAFAPHPDDAEIGCGGTLAKLSRLGYRTGIVDLTRGEMSSAGDLQTRAEETSRASKVLGLTHRENLELPDAWLDPHAGSDFPAETREQLSPVTKVVHTLRRLRPELVLVPYGVDRHPDHVAASELLLRAAFLAGNKKFAIQSGPPSYTVPQLLFYQMRFQFNPTFVVDITENLADKVAAIQAFGSQLTRSPGVETLLNSPLTLAAIEARDRYYGSMIGVQAAEPFLSRQLLGIVDPIEHFRRNNYSSALMFPPQE